ncbi:FAD-dependent oxidoreductase [Candidatus Pacearchaeota archaeon]|nr:FAD-dependent oxidoreductase [Candidatus Pacearchaeota archaeon]
MKQLQNPLLLKFDGKIADIVYLTPTVKQYTIEIPKGFSFIPGQFVSIVLNNGEQFKRSYSIASTVNNKKLELCIKILENGKGTQILDKCKSGDVLKMQGPMGRFVIQEKSWEKDLYLIATGTGITPFRPMIPYLLGNDFQNRIHLVVGYKTEDELLYHDELIALEKKHPNLKYISVFSRDSNHDSEHVQDKLTNVPKDAHYYVCGIKEMVMDVREILALQKVPVENIFFERYS